MTAVDSHYCVKLARVTNRFTLRQKAFEFSTIRFTLGQKAFEFSTIRTLRMALRMTVRLISMRSALLRRWIDKIELAKAMSEFVTGPAGDYMYRLDFGRNIFLSRGHALIRCRIPSSAMFWLLNRAIWHKLSPESLML